MSYATETKADAATAKADATAAKAVDKEAEAKAAADKEKADQFKDENIHAFRALVKLARDLDEMVDRRVITPKDATERLKTVANTPVEPKKPIPAELPQPKSKLEEAIAKAVEVPDPDAKTGAKKEAA